MSIQKLRDLPRSVAVIGIGLLLLLELISNFQNAPAPAASTNNNQPRQHAIILQYHHISDNTPASTSTSIKLFKQQLELIKTSGFSVWPLEKIIDALQHHKKMPLHVLALTFDDAYADFYTHALPELKKYRWPATIFVPTKHISQHPTEFMSWQQLKNLRQQNISLGSHSHSHNYLAREIATTPSPEMQQLISEDIITSLKLLKQHSGQTTRLFAYPYGEYTEKLKQIVEKQGLVAFGQQSGPINAHSDFLALPRFPASNQFGQIDDLKIKLFTQPFSGLKTEPHEPITYNHRPELTLILENHQDAALDLHCYASSLGEIPLLKTVKNNAVQYKTQINRDLPAGRSRYNCTAESEKQFFYWFSQPWIILPED